MNKFINVFTTLRLIHIISANGNIKQIYRHRSTEKLDWHYTNNHRQQKQINGPIICRPTNNHGQQKQINGPIIMGLYVPTTTDNKTDQRDYHMYQQLQTTKQINNTEITSD